MGPFIALLFLAVSTSALSFKERQNINAITELNNQLATDLYKKLSAGDENVFFSPLSISTALAMLFYGARGLTADEMRRALGYQDARLSDADVHSAFQALIENISKESVTKDYLLYVANAVLTQKNFSVLPEYKSGLQNIYKAKASEVDFQNGQKAVFEINNWVKSKTNNKITKLVNEIDPDTVMVLLNAVYFKGTWKTQFDPKNTNKRAFFNKGSQNDITSVPMMYLFEEFPYVRLDGVRILELPYKGQDISMFILLPDTTDGLTRLEQELKPTMFRDARRLSLKTKLHVNLPRFKLEYAKVLNTVLQELGIKRVFENNADLSGITKSGPIALSKAVHKAVLEVNEEGSEAAAVTGMIIATRMGGMDNAFVVNHPFLFAIVDKRTDMILFQGRINKL